MGLEAATFIHQLNSSNPVGGTDQKKQGDDHLRLIKAALLATFPNFAGAVNSSNSQIDSAITAVAALPTFAHGRHTPTTTGASGITGLSVNAQLYIRVGSIIVAAGTFFATAVTNNVGFSFRFSLPVASNLATGNDLRGLGVMSYGEGTPKHDSVLVFGNSTNDDAIVSGIPGTSDSVGITLAYMYEIK